MSCCVPVKSIPQSDSPSASELCLDGSLISRLASPFLVSLLTIPCLALYLLLANYLPAIAITSVPSCGHYSSNFSTPASRLAKMITSTVKPHVIMSVGTSWLRFVTVGDFVFKFYILF